VDDRLFLYSHFGSDEPDIFLDTVRFLVTACQCGVVIVDHITMVCSGLSGEDERRALDYISTRLEMMVRSSTMLYSSSVMSTMWDKQEALGIFLKSLMFVLIYLAIFWLAIPSRRIQPTSLFLRIGIAAVLAFLVMCILTL